MARGQTIPNPSFETDSFTVWPGYINLNTQITGWTANQDDRAGLNPASGSPFADNGTVPDGKNVAFIQSAALTILSTTIADLKVGTTYKVTFRANARNGQTPNLRVSIDDQELLALTVYSVGGASPYCYLAFEFTATATSQTMTLLNDADGDNTVLVDDFKIAPTSGKWSVAAWTGDEDSGVDANYFYTHAYNFGSGANPTINGVRFTGVAGGSPAVPGQFSTTYLGNLYTGDANNIVGESIGLASDFVYGGTVAAGNFQSITIMGLTPGTEYVMKMYTVGWESPGLGIRWATWSVGEDRLTINQDQFDNNNGLSITYRYTADASGTMTLKIAPVNPSNVSIHIYGFSNREAVSRNVAPAIIIQPKNVTVPKGEPATFSVAATGIPTPSCQWRFKGANIAGANNPTYTVSPVTDADAGNYDVVVMNSMGAVTSIVARLTVGLAMNNPSFEADTFTVWPGYVSGNGPITGWNALDGHGINPASGSPFADNGAIPHGQQVAFMQADGALSQTVSGFTPGAQYYLHYFENSRTTVTPWLEVRLGGNKLIAPHAVLPVGGSNPYYEVFSDVFVATNTDLELAFVKSNPLAGDSTALIDNVAFVQVQPSTPPFLARSPGALLVSVGDTTTFSAQGIGTLPLSYQWLKNGVEITGATGPTLTLSNIQKPDEADYSVCVTNEFGKVTSPAGHLTVYEPIPDLYNTGVDNNRNVLPDGAVDPHYRLIENPDTGSADAIVEDSTVFPIVAGPWVANNSISKWIGPRLNTSASAVGFYTYRTVIVLEDRDPSTLVIEGQWSTDNAGREIRVNGVATSNPQNPGFNVYTPFTIYGTNANFVNGTNTIDFIVENVAAIGYTGLRVQIIRSNLRIPPGVAPEILTQPISQKVAEGETVTFVAAARGTAPLSYQWYKDGLLLPGQTSLTLTLTGVTTADSGNYTLSVSNPVGRVVSIPANLSVWLRPIPGIVFGTGTDDNGALLPAGAVDPHYILLTSADPLWPGPDAMVVNEGWPIQAGVWVLNGPNSKWIGPQADQSGVGGNAEGDYVYRTTFNLTGYDASQVRLLGAWAADNTGIDILVNGANTGITSAGFGGLTPFTIAGRLVAGTNTLDFIVNNLPATPNPTAVRVDLKAYAIIQLAVPPALRITLADKTVSVSWSPAAPGQQLQSAPAVTGPWTEIPGASNPYSTGVTGAMKFFRVVTP
jgi:hypothetical protein